MVQLLDDTREQPGRADLPMAIGHITPFLYVGTPDWDVGDSTITGSPQEVADADPRRRPRAGEPDPGPVQEPHPATSTATRWPPSAPTSPP